MITIRSFEDKDCERVAEVARSVIGEVWPRFRSIRSVKAASDKFNPSFFLAQAKFVDYWVAVLEDSTVVGVVGLEGDEVKSFFVAAKYLHQGVGRMLSEYVDRIARMRKLKRLRVKSSEAAEPIYERLGYRKIKVLPETIDGEAVKEIQMMKFL